MSVHNSAQILKPPSQKQLNNEEALKVYAVFLAGLVILGVVAHGVRRYPNKDVPPTVSKDLRSLNFKAVQLSSKYVHIPYPLCKQLIILSKTCQTTHRPGMAWETPIWACRFSQYFLGCQHRLVLDHLAGSSHELLGLQAWMVFTFQNFHLRSHQLMYARMAAANMVLCVSMAVKNTPLALISTISHAQLNIIHRIVGYTTVFMVILHAILYTAFFGQDGRWATLLKPSNLAGIGAGIAMIVLLMGFFRHRGYTVFYISHFLGFSVLVVLVWLHRPDWAKKLPYVAVISGCIWMLDRSIRMCTLGYNIVNNTATLFSLPDGGTRILLRKPIAPAGTLAGLHYYLWLPRFRFWTAHPFTVVNNGPFGVELVMKSHEGFTKYVGDFAIQFSGCLTWASMHGPYGCQPDVESYDRVVFICGGSGGAFMFGLLNYMMNRPDSLKGQQVQAIWAVRREGMFKRTSKYPTHLLTS